MPIMIETHVGFSSMQSRSQRASRSFTRLPLIPRLMNRTLFVGYIAENHAAAIDAYPLPRSSPVSRFLPASVMLSP